MCPNIKRLTINADNSNVTADGKFNFIHFPDFLGFIHLIGGLSKLQLLDVKNTNFTYYGQEEAIFSTLQNCLDLETLRIKILVQEGRFKPLPKLKYFSLSQAF